MNFGTVPNFIVTSCLITERRLLQIAKTALGYNTGKILDCTAPNSGVGFNLKNDYKIECDNDQWAQIVKQDRNARFMRFKSWPMWEDWKLIFGKYRATGDVSEDSHDSYNVYNVPNKVGSGVGGADFSADPAYHSKTTHSKTTPSPQQDPLGTPDESTGQSMHASQQSKINGKKRKAPSDLVGLIDVLKKMQEDTNLRLDKLISRIGFEFDVSKLRKEVVAMVEAIPGLTLLQQIDVAEIILDKVERIELFMCLSEASRPTYMMRALEKYG
ncbi:hypothetical protein AAHA92_18174 [Salvia divinorum]|uniref:Uncharacterized protein n=1 Tax=Salvia divinorum TaxID=28513 RepID=A0ABD1H2I3_SALDI